MKKKLLSIFILVVFSFSFFVFSADKKEEKIPDFVEKAFKQLKKGKAENPFGIELVKSYHWALQTNVYSNVSFKANLLDDVKRIKSEVKVKYDEAVAKKKKIIEERNKKIKDESKKLKWEPPKLEEVMPKVFHGLYLRVYRDGKLIQHYKAPVPYDDKPEKFYSFGIILDPGQYELHIVIADVVYKEKVSAAILYLTVPDVTMKALLKKRGKLSISDPVFYDKVLQLSQENRQFTVTKNYYEIGPAKLVFYPHLENKFKVTDSPTLAFFIYGTSPALIRGQSQPQWDIEAKIKIKDSNGKDALKFKPLRLKNFYFFQQIKFEVKDKKLKPGNYTLLIELQDKNNRKKGKVKIPVEII